MRRSDRRTGHHAGMPAESGPESSGNGPLHGLTVGVTAARKAEELAGLLERRGARVLHGAAVRIVPVEDDDRVVDRTRDLLAAPPDVIVATTGVGFRGWLAGAERWGLR